MKATEMHQAVRDLIARWPEWYPGESRLLASEGEVTFCVRESSYWLLLVAQGEGTAMSLRCGFFDRDSWLMSLNAGDLYGWLNRVRKTFAYDQD